VLIIISTLVILAIFILILKKKESSDSDDRWPYYAKKPLTQIEQVLYHRLVSAMPEYIVLAQVQLSQILGVEKGANFGQWHNRINRMSIDFLVCQKDSTVIAAIELDDKTHTRQSRVESDAKKDKALRDANIKIIRWNTGNLPDEVTIQNEIAA